MAKSDDAQREPLLDEGFLSRIERLSLVSRATILGKVRGERRSRRRGFSTEFADYRDYVAGDDLRYLDWNIFGRLERLFVKLFHEEEDLTLSILIDTSSSMTYGNPQKLRYACQVAAALGYIALTTDDRVAVYPFDAELRQVFPPLRGKKNARRLFQHLEDILYEERGEGIETNLLGSLTTFSRAFAKRGMAVLISDLLDPAGFEGALNTLAGSRLETFLIHLLAPDEIDPTLVGDLRLVDSEDASVTEISINRTLMKAYVRSLEGFRESIKQACSQKGLSPLFASTSMPFEHMVLGYLRSRGLVA